MSAVGPSALRGQGKGVLYAAQQVLKDLNLLTLPNDRQEAFRSWLDKQTIEILNAMPTKNPAWGAARKAINLFLRDALYNRYLCPDYRIDKVEYWLEIPLDSAVAKGLIENDTEGDLPAWPRLKRLNRDDSDKYQKFAGTLADKEGIARVHLDIVLWLRNRRGLNRFLPPTAKEPFHGHQTDESGYRKRVGKARNGEAAFEATTERGAGRYNNNAALGGRLTTNTPEFKNRVLQLSLSKTQR